MKTLIQRAGHCRSINKILIGLVFASAISALSITSAFADRDGGYRGGNRGHQEWRDQGRHQKWRGDHDRYKYRGNPQAYPQPYGYARPIYVPPPVYYPPQQSPGISLFFPLNFNR